MWSTITDEKFTTESQKQIYSSEERPSNLEEKTGNYWAWKTERTKGEEQWPEPQMREAWGGPVHSLWASPGFSSLTVGTPGGSVRRRQGGLTWLLLTHCGKPGRHARRCQGDTPGFSTEAKQARREWAKNSDSRETKSVASPKLCNFVY